MFRHVVKEVKVREHLPLWQTSIIIMFAIIFINYLITKSNMLTPKYGNIASILILLGSLAVFAFSGYRYLSSFIYILDEDELVFKRGITDSNNPKLIVTSEELQWIKPYEDVVKNKEIKRTYKFLFKKDKTKMYVGEFIRNGRKYRFIFEPGPKMKKALKLEKVYS